MVVYAGQGDAHRSLSLLWGATPEPGTGRTGRSGPKPGLSVDAIVSAGIAVADTDGMAALSMRAVGERLGRTAMALYTYVPGKAELLDLMHDRALAELPADPPVADGWRSAVTAWAEELYACYLRHPWMLQVSQARPVLGPAELAAMERLLRALRPAALAPGRLPGVVAALWQLVRGMAAVAAESRGAAAATGVADEDWWTTRSARLAELAPDFPERFPLLTALQGAADGTPQDRDQEAFRTGLAVLLDGVAASAAAAD
ncbi:AcrR family transcriptional regulator [Kitasatospora sp. MAA19]|uniref:TetR/AcrR family transcriptional regulator n=1 Tax=unclassified Kitasatospora TaxID=2633591 RepID=UPI0024731328|nr:TetR/AcrR family transcriptional regulator C-terminal domain-containing protein [Kitasatospora sp. MAA19]MDH6708829.1 AcrR family transcriptional regulator [Kitasatospora sp. MAA19]